MGVLVHIKPELMVGVESSHVSKLYRSSPCPGTPLYLFYTTDIGEDVTGGQ